MVCAIDCSLEITHWTLVVLRSWKQSYWRPECYTTLHSNTIKWWL